METWKPIPSTGGSHSASSKGRVRANDRVSARGRTLPARLLSAHPDNAVGYLHVRLYGSRLLKPGSGATVHALVAEAFHGPRPARLDVMHINADPADNCPENLRYGTRSENMQAKIGAGKRKLSDKQIREIRTARSRGVSGLDLAEKYGVSNPFIYMIANRRAYWWIE